MIFLLAGSLLGSSAQALWVPVNVTPYDHQMQPVHKFLVSAAYQPVPQVNLAEIAARMRPIHRMPYRFQDTWPTPDQVRTAGRADCKGKAVLLLDELRRAGIHGMILVIGVRTPVSRETHAWLELTADGQDLILDPTYSSRPFVREAVSSRHYQRHFAYAGSQKWSAISPGWLVASR